MHKLDQLGHQSFAQNHAVSQHPDGTVLWPQFCADIAATRVIVRALPATGWALYHPDSYQFSVGLFALLAEQRDVYLPAENHPRLAAELSAKGLHLMGEFPSCGHEQIITGAAPSEGEFQLAGAVVVYTSGSTGEAKPIRKTLAQLDSELHALETSWEQPRQAPLFLATVSHQHFYGLLFTVLWPICAGRRFWHRPFVDPEIMARATAEADAAIWVMSPAHLHRMPPSLPWPSVKDVVHRVFSSGGPLSHAAAQSLHTQLGQYPVEVLGSSETGGIAQRQQNQPDAPWRALPGVETHIGEDGRLAVRSPWLGQAHWYVSADMASPSESGDFTLGMRADRLVKLEGKRVALPAVEAALSSHEFVDDVAVAEVKRRRRALGAALVLTTVGRQALDQHGRHSLLEALRASVRDQLGGACVPRHWKILEALPRNSQGKLKAAQLARLFQPALLPTVLDVQHDETRCKLSLHVSAANPYFSGHFPEQPVLPGVVQLHWAEHFARELLALEGQFAGMKSIKFRQLIYPETTLSLTLQYQPDRGRLKFQFDSGDSRHSQGILLFEQSA